MSGLRRATLATIETRTYTVEGKPLHGVDIATLYHLIPNERSMAKAVQDVSGGRRWDRALSVLKKAGLVEFKDRQWRHTGRAP